MKRAFRTVALVIAMCMATTSCQKENLIEPQGIEVEIQAVRNVGYTIDGISGNTTLLGDTEWRAFLERMVALAEEGHSVYFWDESKVQASNSKDIVTYSTPDRNDAIKWADKMIDNGYYVTITYNETTNQFDCIAIK